MKKWFIIYYKVIIGNADKRDVALISAADENSAKKTLKNYLDTRAQYKDLEVSLIKEYRGLVFTRNFGQDD